MLDLCWPTLYARNFKSAILKAYSPRVAHLTPIEKLTQWVYYLRPLPGPNTHKQYLFQLEWYNQTNAQINTRSQHMLVTLLLWRSPNHLRLQSVKGTQVCAKEPSFKSSSNFSFCSSILQFINSSILHSSLPHPIIMLGLFMLVQIIHHPCHHGFTSMQQLFASCGEGCWYAKGDNSH